MSYQWQDVYWVRRRLCLWSNTGVCTWCGVPALREPYWGARHAPLCSAMGAP